MRRDQVLAYRIAAHQLHRVDVPPGRLAVLDLGVQDASPVALAARTTADLADPDLVTMWTLRGAPHLIRRADAPAFAAALWPLSDADARARIDNARIRTGAALGLAAFDVAARAMRDVVTGPMPKGEVSGAVSARVPPSLSYDCAPCRSRHISGALFQQVGVAAGVQVRPVGNRTELAPLGLAYPVPRAAAGTTTLVRAYLRLHGPATPRDVAAFLGAPASTVRQVWPDDLAEVDVDGRRAWLPAQALPALRDPPAFTGVRLLPPLDPLLQGRDRELLVPDRARRAEVWRMLGNPGVVLHGVEIVGTWRARLAKSRLEVTVTGFGPLPTDAVAAEAHRVARARGAADARVTTAAGG